MSEIQEVEKEYNSDESDDHSKLVSHQIDSTKTQETKLIPANQPIQKPPPIQSSQSMSPQKHMVGHPDMERSGSVPDAIQLDQISQEVQHEQVSTPKESKLNMEGKSTEPSFDVLKLMVPDQSTLGDEPRERTSSSVKMSSGGDRKKSMEDKLNESIIFLKKINKKKEKKLNSGQKTIHKSVTMPHETPHSGSSTSNNAKQVIEMQNAQSAKSIVRPEGWQEMVTDLSYIGVTPESQSQIVQNHTQKSGSTSPPKMADQRADFTEMKSQKVSTPVNQQQTNRNSIPEERKIKKENATTHIDKKNFREDVDSKIGSKLTQSNSANLLQNNKGEIKKPYVRMSSEVTPEQAMQAMKSQQQVHQQMTSNQIQEQRKTSAPPPIPKQPSAYTQSTQVIKQSSVDNLPPLKKVDSNDYKNNPMTSQSMTQSNFAKKPSYSNVPQGTSMASAGPGTQAPPLLEQDQEDDDNNSLFDHQSDSDSSSSSEDNMIQIQKAIHQQKIIIQQQKPGNGTPIPGGLQHHNFTQNSQAQVPQKQQSQSQSPSMIVKKNSSQIVPGEATQHNQQNLAIVQSRTSDLKAQPVKSQSNLKPVVEQQAQTPQHQKQPENKRIQFEEVKPLRGSNSVFHFVFVVLKNDTQSQNQIVFDFDVGADTALGVAKEMVEEFDLPSKNIDLISAKINKEIVQFQQPQLNQSQILSQGYSQGHGHVNMVAANQPQIPSMASAPLQGKDSLKPVQPQKTEQTPKAKVNKESANIAFQKFYNNIEEFVLQLNGGKVSIQDFVEAFEGDEERAAKKQFLCSVLAAQTEYKVQHKAVEEKKRKKKMEEEQLQHSVPVSQTRRSEDSKKVPQQLQQPAQVNTIMGDIKQRMSANSTKAPIVTHQLNANNL